MTIDARSSRCIAVLAGNVVVGGGGGARHGRTRAGDDRLAGGEAADSRSRRIRLSSASKSDAC